jgi:hypothetical protein
LILIALLSHEEADILTKFYNFLKNAYLFNPKKITFDFSLGDVNSITNVFSKNEEIMIIP